jgi:hypothetical protein
VGLFSRKHPTVSGQAGGPTYDATIDHPGVYANALGVDYLPAPFAPDPGGVLARRPSVEFLVVPLETPIQHSPATSWFQGTPYPGPPATVTVPIDMDSQRWWGRTGQGRLVWSEDVILSADLPPALPQDLPQHIDTFQRFWGGFPSIVRNRPAAFGNQAPVLNPFTGS